MGVIAGHTRAGCIPLLLLTDSSAGICNGNEPRAFLLLRQVQISAVPSVLSDIVEVCVQENKVSRVYLYKPWTQATNVFVVLHFVDLKVLHSLKTKMFLNVVSVSCDILSSVKTKAPLATHK